VIPQPDRSVSVRFVFSKQKLLQKVSEFPLQQIAVMKLHRQPPSSPPPPKYLESWTFLCVELEFKEQNVRPAFAVDN
jgi:hypothetical protein